MSSMDQIITEMNFETSTRYARCLANSIRKNWNIDTDPIDGSHFEKAQNKITMLLQQGPF